MSTHNLISLVKGSARVYAVGFNMGGYSPDPDSVVIVATLSDARSVLADMIDRFIDHEAEGADMAADGSGLADDGQLWDGQSHAEAMKESISPDSHTWLEVGDDTGTSVYLTDAYGWGHSYWLQASTIAETFGEDWHSALLADWVPEGLEDIIEHYER